MPVDTNILIFTLDEKISGDLFVAKAKEKGILCSAFAKQNIRFVTHLDFTENMLNETEEILKSIAS